MKNMDRRHRRTRRLTAGLASWSWAPDWGRLEPDQDRTRRIDAGAVAVACAPFGGFPLRWRACARGGLVARTGRLWEAMAADSSESAIPGTLP